MSGEIQVFKPYSIEEGRFLVKLARKAVTEYLIHGKVIDPPSETPEKLLRDRYGVFTTIEVYLGPAHRELRGCIGFPQGYKNVATAVILSAIAAATEDPRFPPMTVDELSKVVFEVSILSPMELIKVEDPRDYLKHIKVGYHGLMIEKGFRSGLLLPQVPVEYGWDEETFLCETCIKAMLPPDAWLERDTRVYRFQAQIFMEVTPNGDVVERDLVEELRLKKQQNP
ncbi:MAG: TIGR00296 family protein [Thermoprotei archaeon]|nr:MAG: TIGR00296 family protein [Thermoprotei archaeon]